MKEPIYLYQEKDTYSLSYNSSTEEKIDQLNEFEPKDIEKIRLVLDWTWDKGKNNWSAKQRVFAYA